MELVSLHEVVRSTPAFMQPPWAARPSRLAARVSGLTLAPNALYAAAGGRLSISPLATHTPHPTPPSTPTPTHARLASSASSRWKLRQGADPFARSARVQGLKSRAAFKLLELDAKYHLFRRGKGQVVVDLGFAPGSWSQVALDRTAPDGRIVGIDIIPAQPPRGVSTFQGNFLSPGVQGMVKQFLLENERRWRAAKAVSAAEKGKGIRRTEHGETEGTGAVEGQGEEEAAVDEVADRPSYIDLERMAAHESEAESGGVSSSPSSTTPDDAAAGGQEADEKPNLRLVDVRAST